MSEQAAVAETATEVVAEATKEAAPAAPEPPAEAQEAEATDSGEAPEKKEDPQEEEVDLLGDEVPHWMNEFDARDKPFKVSKEQMEALPMEAKQLIHNLRKMALDKTRTVASERKALEDASIKHEERVAALNHDKAKLYEIFQNEELQKLLKPPKGEAPPAYTDEGQKWRAEKYVSEMMSKIVGKMTNLSQEAHQEYKKQESDRALANRLTELKSFSDKNPDFKSFKKEIIEYRKSHPSVSSEDAYYLLKAKQGGFSVAPPKEDPLETIKKARKEVRSRLSKTVSSNAAQGQMRPPPGLSAREKAQWYQKNPGASKLVLKQIRGN